jgi:hypothetical protein
MTEGSRGEPATPAAAATPATPATPAKTWRDKPGFFFVTTCTTIGVLLLLALYCTAVPQPRVHVSFSFAPVLPLWVPWAGALGGATISLVGIIKYDKTWDPRYAYWHLARPLLGGVSGTIGVLIVVLVLKSVAATPPGTAGSPAVQDVTYDRAGVAVLAVLGFVIGYREQTFRTLIRRVADVILGPGQAPTTAVVAFVPASLTLTTTGTTQTQQTVHLFNGSSDSYAVNASSLTIEPGGQGFSATLDSEAALSASEARGVTVRWTPMTEGATTTAVLTASLGGRVARVQLTGRSTPQPAEPVGNAPTKSPGDVNPAPPAPGGEPGAERAETDNAPTGSPR